jgi:hypothetical protein
MSVASTLDIEAYRLLDPRLSQNQSTRSFQTTIGGSNITYRKEASTSNSQSQVSFQLTPNSPNNVLDRTFILTGEAVVEFTTTNGAGGNIPDGFITLTDGNNACRGFSAIVDSTNVSVNGLTITQETRFTRDVYQRFADDLDGLVKFKSLTPSLITEGDMFSSYVAGLDTNMNTLGGYRTSQRRSLGRSFYPVVVEANPAAAGSAQLVARVRVKFAELFTISPLEYEGNLVPGLANITSLQVNFNISSEKERFWSKAKSVLPGFQDRCDVSVQFESSSWGVNFCEITLPVFYSLPPSIALSYYDIQRQNSLSKTIPVSTEIKEFNSNTYQLNQTPSRVILYVKKKSEPTANQRIFQSDTFLAIENVSIQYNNMASILSSATPEQLFQISSRNGSTQSYTEFRGWAVNYGSTLDGNLDNKVALTGSVICLDFGKDISSDPTSIPGTSINANISFNVKCLNHSNVASDYELEILYIYSGVMVCSPGAAFSYRSLLTRDETLSLPLLEGDSAGSSHLKGGASKQYGMSGYAKQGMEKVSKAMKGGMDAGAKAAGVHASGRSTGLSGGMAKSKGSLADVFK